MAPSKNAQSGAASTASATFLLDTLLSLSIPALVLLHLVVAPYTKVEESFNIQAAHDVLVYGTPTSDIHHRLSTTYDHFTFPGAVPRTFIGPVLLAAFAQPVVALVGFQHAQLVVRALLGLFNAVSLLAFAANLRRAYGPGAARWYLLLQASQFHVVFYASRTLPNMFAFGLTTLAFAYLFPTPGNPKATARRQRLSITLFVFAAAVFRSEVALLLATTVLYALLAPELSLERVIPPFATSFLTALAISVPIDSYFWQRPLWPELWGFYYNVMQGSSSNWGVSPWHYYFTSALPRLLVNPLAYALLIPLSLWHPALRRAASRLVLPTLLFTAIYSLQPHKETRFIIYAIPPLTAAAALSANLLFTRRSKSLAALLLAAVLCLSILASLAASTAMLALSALNYPGGEALAHLRATILSTPPNTLPDTVPIHADVLSCMTGVTLFGSSTAFTAGEAVAASGGSKTDNTPIKTNSNSKSVRPKLALDKTESPALLASPGFYRQFTYLLTESPHSVSPGSEEWETVAVVASYAGVEILKPSSNSDSGSSSTVEVAGHGKTVAVWRERVRALTGGWWIGPRMEERVWILRRVTGKAKAKGRVVEAR